jgi:tetratricopeptide (TPR) repeat protein
VARSGAKRKPRTAPKPAKARSAPTRHEYSAAESDMFFPKLRSQAKWVFVFLALVFAFGFVALGVGTGGNGLGDIFQGLSRGGGTGGPSVSSAQEKVDKGDKTAYKQLAEAYRAKNDRAATIAAGEKYMQAKPNDVDFARTLASDYEGQATELRDKAQVVQDQLTAATGGSAFSVPESSKLGRALGTGQIDRELTTAANQKLTDYYTGIQTAYTKATALYQQIAKARPDDVLLQLLLAQDAYQSRNVPVAIAAYQRVCKLAPDSTECSQAKQQIPFIKAQAKAAGIPSG